LWLLFSRLCRFWWGLRGRLRLLWMFPIGLVWWLWLWFLLVWRRCWCFLLFCFCGMWFMLFSKKVHLQEKKKWGPLVMPDPNARIRDGSTLYGLWFTTLPIGPSTFWFQCIWLCHPVARWNTLYILGIFLPFSLRINSSSDTHIASNQNGYLKNQSIGLGLTMTCKCRWWIDTTSGRTILPTICLRPRW